MLVSEYEPSEPPDIPVNEAHENLRMIREMMERSTKHSTFSGLSGVFAGLVSVVGCLVDRYYVRGIASQGQNVPFLLNWGVVIIAALGADYLLTKRRAPLVGKTIRSRLGKQMALAAGPGLGMGGLITAYFYNMGMLYQIYPFWMLSYGAAVCAVGLFSQREVSRLGWAFLAGGAITLALQAVAPASALPDLYLAMMALTFGGFHIVYGITVSRRDGW